MGMGMGMGEVNSVSLRHPSRTSAVGLPASCSRRLPMS